MSPVLPREERAAEVLALHTGSLWCPECGLDTLRDGWDQIAHQAAMLAAAGLLADPDALDAAEEENERLRAGVEGLIAIVVRWHDPEANPDGPAVPVADLRALLAEDTP